MIAICKVNYAISDLRINKQGTKRIVNGEADEENNVLPIHYS